MQDEPLSAELSEPLAAVTYSIQSDGEMIIDVNINDYSEETLDQFALLYSSISSQQFQLQGLLIIKMAFDNDEKGTEFDHFASKVVLSSQEFHMPQPLTKEEKHPDDPIIKPTDLM